MKRGGTTIFIPLCDMFAIFLHKEFQANFTTLKKSIIERNKKNFNKDDYFFQPVGFLNRNKLIFPPFQKEQARVKKDNFLNIQEGLKSLNLVVEVRVNKKGLTKN